METSAVAPPPYFGDPVPPAPLSFIKCEYKQTIVRIPTPSSYPALLSSLLESFAEASNVSVRYIDACGDRVTVCNTAQLLFALTDFAPPATCVKLLIDDTFAKLPPPPPPARISQPLNPSVATNQCPQPMEDEKQTKRTKEMFVSSKSQYSVQSVSGCTIMALEAALHLLSGRAPSVELINHVLTTGGYYTSDLHTDLEEIYPAVARYWRNLDRVHQMQVGTEYLSDIVGMMLRYRRESNQGVSAVLTKPPESVSLHLLAPSIATEFPFLLFDSHKRDHHEGAALMGFRDEREVNAYLHELFPPLPAEMGDEMNLMARMYHLIDASFLQLKDGADRMIGRGELLPREVAELCQQFQAIAVKKEAESAKHLAAANANHRSRSKSGRQSGSRSRASSRSRYHTNNCSSSSSNSSSSSSSSASPNNSNCFKNNHGPQNNNTNNKKMNSKQFKWHKFSSHQNQHQPPHAHMMAQKGAQHFVEPQLPFNPLYLQQDTPLTARQRKRLNRKQRQQQKVPSEPPIKQESKVSESSHSPDLTDDIAVAIRLSQQFEEEDRRMQADLQFAQSLATFEDQFDIDARMARELQLAEQEEEAAELRRIAEQQAQQRRQLQADEEFARTFEQQLFKCSICLEDCPIDSIFDLPDSCQHDEEACRDCVRSWVVTKMEESTFPIPCPDPTCPSSIHPDLCQLILDETEMLKFFQLSLTHWADQSGDAYHCPTPDCKGLVCVEGANTYALCPVCQHEWCVKCKTAWHAKSTCEQYQAWRKENDPEGKNVEALMRVNNWRACPSCANVVEKSEGCNHMTCRCKQHFCYLCGQILIKRPPENTYYAHFNQGPCTLFDVNNPLYRGD